MKKTILAIVLVFFTISCASLMDFDGVYRSDGSAVVDPDPYDPMNDALMQTAVILALANSTPAARNDYLLSAYYYPPLMLDHYVPPNIWKDWTALQRSLWIQSAREIDLQNYKCELERIKENLIYDLRREIERAKEKD